MLQMDIEGSEWRVIRTTPSETLRRFWIIVVEFHNLHLLANQFDLQFRFGPVLSKLGRWFDVAHVHPNNNMSTVQVDDLVIPRVLEVTYLRRDLTRHKRPLEVLPHPLDRDCSRARDPILLDTAWPDGARRGGEYRLR
jgi:hypothetical protein